MQFKGKIKAFLQERSGTSQSTGKPWHSQEFVVEDDTQRFPTSFVFNAFNKDLSSLKVGDTVTVYFDGEAREWQGKWFNRLNAFQITPENAPLQQPASVPPAAPYQPPFTPQEDSLPF